MFRFSQNIFKWYVDAKRPQARWLVELLGGRHSLPSKADMQASIAKTQESALRCQF